MVDTLVDGVTLQESGGVVVHEPYRVRAVLELTQLLHTICVVFPPARPSTPFWRRALWLHLTNTSDARKHYDFVPRGNSHQ